MKKLISISTACVFILALLVSIVPMRIIGTNQYTITEPYEYPITPDDPEWLELVSNVDMINACKVPYSLVYQMTTDALLETVLNHPMIGNMFAFSTNTAGVQILSNTYQMGLDELLLRDDLEEALLRKYEPIAVSSAVLPNDITLDEVSSLYSEEISNMELMNILEVIAAQIDLSSNQRTISLLDIIEEKTISKNANSSFYGTCAFTYYETISEQSDIQSYNFDTFVYTSRGNEVKATYTTDPEMTPAEQLSALNRYALYTLADCIENPNRRFNCHSYAWYSQDTVNNYYHVWDPLVYMNDGSYERKYSAQVGHKIYYSMVPTGYPPKPYDNHSGIISSIGSKIYVTSKWSPTGGMYIHPYDHCPWYYEDYIDEDGNLVNITNYISFWTPDYS